jgi:negative regulator of sigma-B (phosphoserine phosphatase)
METIKEPMVEYGAAKFALPTGRIGRPAFLVCCGRNGILIAAIDGIGHGEEAASVSKAAAAHLRDSANEPIISVVERCHEKLRATRGVVLSLACIDPEHGMMTWLDVGNVQGVLLRCDTRKGDMQELLLLRSGVVGSQLPAL